MFKSVWYYNLTKPPLAPPDWIFPPVWSILYFSMLVALLLYLFKSAQNKKSGYIYFAVQLILNLLWAIVFFYLKNMFLALILLDIFVILTIKSFYKVSKISGLILIPYLIWILFATYLNIGYLVLNA